MQKIYVTYVFRSIRTFVIGKKKFLPFSNEFELSNESVFKVSQFKFIAKRKEFLLSNNKSSNGTKNVSDTNLSVNEEII